MLTKFSRRGQRVIGAFLVLVAFASAVTIWGQTAGTGALTGTITDPSGAVVPNAMVTATNLDTGQARRATSGTDGTYKINLLPPGNYKGHTVWGEAGSRFIARAAFWREGSAFFVFRKP